MALQSRMVLPRFRAGSVRVPAMAFTATKPLALHHARAYRRGGGPRVWASYNGMEN